ncbi:MAG: cobalt transport protein CbiM [Candidatus Hinthialibacteria bacterium OLB16]|nr:MAG: cobalt transport protein CbiM [Candidatus Hinthialibacteria bacterium OLB16]
MVVAHIPIILIEGVVTAFVVSFLLKVKPEMLQ